MVLTSVPMLPTNSQISPSSSDLFPELLLTYFQLLTLIIIIAIHLDINKHLTLYVSKLNCSSSKLPLHDLLHFSK